MLKVNNFHVFIQLTVENLKVDISHVLNYLNTVIPATLTNGLYTLWSQQIEGFYLILNDRFLQNTALTLDCKPNHPSCHLFPYYFYCADIIKLSCFILEFLKWTSPSLTLVRTSVPNGGLSRKSKHNSKKQCTS